MQEVWKSIDGFEGLYEISNLGRVKTCQHVIMRKRGRAYPVPERIIKGSCDTKGYYQVELKKDGKRNIRFIHRLVAEAFIENPEGKKQVNHKDGDKTNNMAENLEWVTCLENIRHAWEHGLNKPIKGENHGNHVLTEDAVRYIRKNYIPRDKEFGLTALAKRFGVTTYPVYNVLRGKGWKHVQ